MSNESDWRKAPIQEEKLTFAEKMEAFVSWAMLENYGIAGASEKGPKRH